MVSLIENGRAELARKLQDKVNDFNVKNLGYALACAVFISSLHALRFYGGAVADVAVTVSLISGYVYWSTMEKENQSLL